MKINNFIASSPISFFILLGLMVLVLPSVLLPYWFHNVKKIEERMKVTSQGVSREILHGIESKANLLLPLNSSATNLARILSASTNETQLSFPNIESQVAPFLFEAISTIPYLSQASYIGVDGLSFSYYIKRNQQQPIAVYSNTSMSINQTAINQTFYSQKVNCDTGKPYGEAAIAVPNNWSQIALGSSKRYAWLATPWNDTEDLLLYNAVDMGGRGVISLGYQVKSLANFLSEIYSNEGTLYLATKNGESITEWAIPNTRIVIADNSVEVQLLNSNGDEIGRTGNVSCHHNENEGGLKSKMLKIWGESYMLHCSPFEIVGTEWVFVLATSLNGVESLVHKNFNVALVLLLVMFVAMFASIVLFVNLIVLGTPREWQLRAALMKQMEETQKAERKSLNKCNAFASASHDVRACLAGVTGLIEISHEQVPLGSELKANLNQMESCTKDLLALLNSILDTSKAEAGKMQLDEEEFELAHLLEDVADLFHTVAMKKGVDVVLDLSDGSAIKFSRVKGDRGKLKQILCNLVSNAVKFTFEGHVSIRAYARKPTFANSILVSSQSGPLSWLPCFVSKKDEPQSDYKTISAIQQDENCMEFVFEVDDTGKGIPKEKASSVFENYVQIKETAQGQEGTGLGLGIVQSLVRLMGGEINIVDKEFGKKGACFRFNTYLSVCHDQTDYNQMASSSNVREFDIESHGSYLSGEFTHSNFNSPIEGSQVVLFIRSEERCKASKKFMERQGIKVSVVKHYEQLSTTLRNIKQMLILSEHNSFKKSDANRSDCLSVSSSTKSKDVPLSSLDGMDQVPPPPPPPTPHRRTKTRTSTTSFVLIVIDTNGGPFRELSRAVAEFRKDLVSGCSRVVWVDKPGAGNIIHTQGLEDDKLPQNDIIISKPFHGSRLSQVIGFLPEFGGIAGSVINVERTLWPARIVPVETSSSRSPMILSNAEQNSVAQNSSTVHGEIEEQHQRTSTTSLTQISWGPRIEEQKNENEKPLNGKKVLVVEDHSTLRKIASVAITRLGATVEICENGQEALENVCKCLSEQKMSGAPIALPYDYIFMDCEMPIMDGFEATKRIREEEEQYGVHIPIIALSAHSDGEEIRKMSEAGMDNRLAKPLNPAKLLQAIADLHNN